MSKRAVITELRNYVFKLCGCDTHGGRAKVLSHDQCVVYDVPKWNDAMSRCVSNHFPSVQITVSHESKSLTGFQILFVLPEEQSMYLYSFATFVVITLASIPLLWGLFHWVVNTLET
jgi:hypothetical protein